MKRFLINSFILLNITAVYFGSSRPLAEQTTFERFFSPYLVHTRLLQSWQLFTPSPRKFLLNYRVEITFRDGATKTWRRPYPPNWDFFARHLSYHFQKWDLASNYLERPGMNKLLWSDLAVFIERQYNSETNPPDKIALIRSEADVPPPHESGYVGLEQDLSSFHWRDQTLFTYSVSRRVFL